MIGSPKDLEAESDAAARIDITLDVGNGWELSHDDDETIDVDPEVLKELRSSPTGTVQEEETVVAKASRLADRLPDERMTARWSSSWMREWR